MYIYTITSLKKHDIGDGLNRLVYVGSCKNYNERFRIHKRDCFNPNGKNYNSKKYKIIREIGWDNFVFEVILVMSDDTTDEELLKMEQKYIDKFEAKKSLNTNEAIGFDMVEYHKGYYIKNIDKIKVKNKNWYEENKEKLIEDKKKWRSNTENRQRENELQRNRRLTIQTFRQFCNISIYE